MRLMSLALVFTPPVTRLPAADLLRPQGSPLQGGRRPPMGEAARSWKADRGSFGRMNEAPHSNKVSGLLLFQLLQVFCFNDLI